MSEYTPGLAAIREHYVWMHGDPSKGDAGERFDREIAEVERAAAARALREFAQHLIKSVMPEHGSHINMTPYREGLVDGVNRAVAAAGRRAAEIREEQ